MQVGRGPWLVWAGGSARRTGDYDTPEGTIENSAARLANGTGGFGWSGNRGFFSVGVTAEDSRYGIPFAGQFEAAELGIPLEEAPDIDIDMTRQDYRFDAGVRNLDGLIRGFRASLNYVDYQHTEIEVEDGEDIPATVFDNELFIYRAEAEQAARGRLSGRFGIWGQTRDYVTTGAEALAPPTTQNAFAAFAYEELNFGRWRLQFGGRVEHNSYTPDPRPEGEEEEGGEEEAPPEVRDRSFTGFSGSVGLHTDIGSTGAFIVNLTRSSRAPALEELYNFGPHIGNLAFEIGNPDLETESSFGLDVSLRRRSGPVHGEVSAFIYDISNFVFLSFTDEIADGLRVAPFLQGDSRFVGFDGDAGFELGGGTHLNIGLGYVRATLTDTDEALPRIPPFHGSVDLEIPWKQLTFKPELVWAADQDRTFREETPTAGYALFNIGATWLAPTSAYDARRRGEGLQPVRRDLPAPHVADQGSGAGDGARDQSNVLSQVLLNASRSAGLGRRSVLAAAAASMASRRQPPCPQSNRFQSWFASSFQCFWSGGYRLQRRRRPPRKRRMCARRWKVSDRNSTL